MSFQARRMTFLLRFFHKKIYKISKFFRKNKSSQWKRRKIQFYLVVDYFFNDFYCKINYFYNRNSPNQLSVKEDKPNFNRPDIFKKKNNFKESPLGNLDYLGQLCRSSSIFCLIKSRYSFYGSNLIEKKIFDF